MYNNLQNAISENGYTLEEFAHILDMHRNTLANKLNGESPFTLPEVQKIITLFKRYRFDYIFSNGEPNTA